MTSRSRLRSSGSTRATGSRRRRRFAPPSKATSARPALVVLEYGAWECRNHQSAAGGKMRHLFENHDLVTERCGQLIDVTDDVLSAVERSDVANGMALV